MTSPVASTSARVWRPCCPESTRPDASASISRDSDRGGSMKVRLISLLASLPLVAAAAAFAHHSFAAEYDAAKPVTLKGKVTKVEWTNPHARFYIDVKND